MRGRIASRQKCPACGQAGHYDLKDFGRGRRALLCKCGGFIANRLEVVIRWHGVTYRLTHDQTSQRLTDYLHAERALGLINNQIERGGFFPALWTSAKANKLLWENYLADYLAREERRLPRATFVAKRANARHLAWFNGRNVREIRAADLADFAVLPCLELALSPGTRQNLMVLLQHLFRQAVNREDIERAPVVPRIAQSERAIPWLMPEEQALVLANIPHEDRPIFEFMFLYGCRPSEACALFWDAVDRPRGVLFFRRTISAGRLAENTKTRRDREVPIFDAFAGFLDSIPTGIGPTPVFTNLRAQTRHKRYDDHALNRVWHRAVAAAGLPPIPLKNGTRHSAGMQRLNLDGWHDSSVAMLLGHATSRTTQQFYARPQVALLKRLVDKDGHAKVVNLLSTENGPSQKDN
jgi:integrase